MVPNVAAPASCANHLLALSATCGAKKQLGSMSAQLGSSLVSAINICLKSGEDLLEICSDLEYSQRVCEQLTRIKACWLQIALQLELLRELSTSLKAEHLSVHLETIPILNSKLRVVIARIAVLPKTPLIKSDGSNPANALLRPWRQAILTSKLDASMADLASWQKMFDPSWYLILRTASKAPARKKVEESIAKIEKQDNYTTHFSRQQLQAAPIGAATLVLREQLRVPPPIAQEGAKGHVFLAESGLQAMIKEDITYSRARIGSRPDKETADPSRVCILETIVCPQNNDRNVVTRNVRDFALKLSSMEPLTFGLLRCKGVVRHKTDADGQKFTFVFRIPMGFAQPRALRQILLEKDNKFSLSERFKLAAELAKAVSFVHVLGFVHQNVLPENIILLNDHSSALGSAFLLGFEQIRTAEGVTFRLGTSAWEKDLYSHPQRQGLAPKHDYLMQHDIYSLGVCLLEIGLWTSFVGYSQSGTKTPGEAVSALFNDEKLPEDRKLVESLLVDLARVELPHRMGTQYTDIVITCLTCLDPGNLDFGDEDEFQDEDGIVVGVRFIEKVLMKLNELII